MLKDIPISRKLPFAIAMLTFVSVALIGALSYFTVRNVIKDEALVLLESAQANRATQISAVFEELDDDIKLLGRDIGTASMVNAMVGSFFVADPNGNASAYLRGFYVDKNPNPEGQRYQMNTAEGEKSPYTALHERWHPWVVRMIQTRGWADLMVVDTDGNVVYSYGKGAEFGNNIGAGALSGSVLDQIANQALDHGRTVGEPEVFASTLAPYPFGGEGLFSLMSTPVFNIQNEMIGAIVFRIPDSSINEVLSMPYGQSYDVRSYLIAPDGTALVGFDDATGEKLPDDLADVSAIVEIGDALRGQIGTTSLTTDAGEAELLSYGPINGNGSTYGLVLEAGYDDVMSLASTMRNSIAVSATIVVVIAALIGVVIARSLLGPLAKMRQSLNQIATQRDLTGRVGLKNNDELGASSRAVDDILAVMDESIGEIRSATDQVATVASSMEIAAQSMASNADVQSSAVEELSSSAEETASQVRNSASAARAVENLVSASAETAVMGKDKVQEMVAAMEAISKSSRDISKIINVIDEIAFQTNLLALNAAVEAARAGQHGRGFAVVAQEVRNLAARSAKAARETSALIEDSGQRVNVGVEISNQTSEAFDKIAEDVAEAARLVADITTAAEEQSRGVDLINSAIANLAGSVRDSSEQAESFATTAAQLSATNDHLRNQVSTFRSRGASAAYQAPQIIEHEDYVQLPAPRAESRKSETRPASKPAPKPAAKPASSKGSNRPANRGTTPASDADERGYGIF